MDCTFLFCAEAQLIVAIGCLVFVAYCAGRNDWNRQATRVSHPQLVLPVEASAQTDLSESGSSIKDSSTAKTLLTKTSKVETDTAKTSTAETSTAKTSTTETSNAGPLPAGTVDEEPSKEETSTTETTKVKTLEVEPLKAATSVTATSTSVSTTSSPNRTLRLRQAQLAQKPSLREPREQTSGDCTEEGEPTGQRGLPGSNASTLQTNTAPFPNIVRVRPVQRSRTDVASSPTPAPVPASTNMSALPQHVSENDMQPDNDLALRDQRTHASAVTTTFPTYPHAGSSVQSRFDPYARFMADPFLPSVHGESASTGALRYPPAAGIEHRSSFSTRQHDRSAAPPPDPRPSFDDLDNGEGSSNGRRPRPLGSTRRTFSSRLNLDTRQRYRRNRSPYPTRQHVADHDDASDGSPSSPSNAAPDSPSSATSSSSEPPSPQSDERLMEDEYDHIDDARSIPSSRQTTSSESEGWNDLEDYDMIDWYEATERERENGDGLPPHRSVLADAAIGFRDLLSGRRHGGI